MELLHLVQMKRQEVVAILFQKPCVDPATVKIRSGARILCK